MDFLVAAPRNASARRKAWTGGRGQGPFTNSPIAPGSGPPMGWVWPVRHPLRTSVWPRCPPQT